MKSTLICCLIILSFIGLFSCSQKPDVDVEKAKVKDTVDNFGKFWETEDTVLLSEMFVHDPNMVNYGAEENEVFVGWNALRDSLTKILPAFDQTKVTIRNQIIHVSDSGDAAWFSEIMDWNLLYEGKPALLPNQRLTGVLEKKNGKWVIVQFHNSAPGTPH